METHDLAGKRGAAVGRQPNRINKKKSNWLGRQGSNLGMPESKSGALPLGDAPTTKSFTTKPATVQLFTG
jgi:hypothetical protein